MNRTITRIEEIQNIEFKLTELEQRLDAAKLLFDQHQISDEQFEQIVDQASTVSRILEERLEELGVLSIC